MTTFFQNHCNDFKLHLLLLVTLTVTFFSISFYYCDQWLYVLMDPFLQIQPSNYFIVTDLMEIFSLKITLAMLLSWIAVGFMFFLQSWFFLAPGLYKHENKWIGQILMLFGIGLSLSLYLIFIYLLPYLWIFFYEYGTTEYPFLFHWYLEPKLSNYILLVMKTLGWMTLFSQYPLVLFLLLMMQVITLHQLTKFRKLLYVQLLVLASFLAPPDMSSQFVIFAFLVGWTESMICSFYIVTKK